MGVELETGWHVAVIGCGYVGTVVAASFARLGHRVTGVEINEEKLADLQAGKAHFYEPGLDLLLRVGLSRSLLSFTAVAAEAVAGADAVFLCVDAPEDPERGADLTSVRSAIAAIAPHVSPEQVVVTKSTLPVGAAEWVATTLRRETGFDVPVVVNPEFLREGAAVDDFLHPSRVVFGGDDVPALGRVEALYRPILDQSFESAREGDIPEIIVTNRASAEMIKYAANTFLASRLSLINEIAQICDAVGADIEDVAAGLGTDPRIGSRYLRAGLGWGGSCFDKDLAIFAGVAREAGVRPTLIEAARSANKAHRVWVFEKIATLAGSLADKRVALLGISFKPETDDLRDAPAVELAQRFIAAGAQVTAHDPVVKGVPDLPELAFASDAHGAATGADLVVLATEWDEYAELDFATLAPLVARRLVIDTRNFLDAPAVAGAGFEYHAIGRPGDLPHRGRPGGHTMPATAQRSVQ